MSDARIDRSDTLEAQEKFGAIVRLIRRVRVTGLEDTNYNVLFSALEAAGIPAAGTKLTEAPNLVLTERNPKLVDEGTVDVDLVYEHGLNEGQNIDSPPFASLLVGEVQATINQTTSNTDGDGNQVTLTHTYPEDDPDFAGLTKTQVGEFQYFEPQITLKYQGLKRTDFPWLVSQAIVGAVNRTPWAGGEAYTWMCTSCSWKPFDRKTPGRYQFSFEFQNNPDKWNPTVIFVDPRDNKPVVGASVEDGSIKEVRKHREVDFEQIIGARVQGG